MRRLTSICWFVRVYITEDGRGNVDVDVIISSAIAVQTRTVKKKKPQRNPNTTEQKSQGALKHYWHWSA